MGTMTDKNLIIIMKKSVLNTAFLLFAIIGSICLSACSSSSDDEGTKEEINKRDKIKVEYSINLDDNWYQFFDIEVTYNAGLGEKTEKLTQDWIFTYELPYEVKPALFTCKVVAKPKSKAPAVEEGKTYSLACSCKATAAAYFKNGQQDMTYGQNGSKMSNTELSSQGMEKYILQEHTIFTYTLNNNQED